MAAINLASPRRTHPPGYHLPVNRKEGDQTVQFGNVHDLGSIDIDVAWAREARPLPQEVPLRGKDLDTVVLSVRHEYAAIGMHPDSMRHMKLTRRAFAWRSP